MMFLEQDPVITVTVARTCGVRTAAHISLQSVSCVNRTNLPVWEGEACVCGRMACVHGRCRGCYQQLERPGMNGRLWDHVPPSLSPSLHMQPASPCGVGLSVRRVDSCGSLDSHTQHSTVPPVQMGNQPQPLTRVLSPQELRSPLKHFQPRGLHGNKSNGLSRGSPRRLAVKKTLGDHSPSTHRAKGPAIMHLRAQSAPETQV